MHRILQTVIVALVLSWHVTLLYSVYPAFLPLVLAMLLVLWAFSPLVAVALVYHWAVDPVDMAKHLGATIVFLFGSHILLIAGVISPIPGVAPVLIYRTLLWLVPVVLAYYAVFELDLLDRDGPLGERLGLAEASE